MDTQINEELVHLADVCGIAVRVEERGGGHGVPHVHGGDLRAPPRLQTEDVDVLAVGEGGQEQEPGGMVRNHPIGRWVRWEEGEFRGHG